MYELGEGTNIQPYVAEGQIIEHPPIDLDKPKRRRSPRAPTEDLVMTVLDRDDGHQERIEF